MDCIWFMQNQCIVFAFFSRFAAYLNVSVTSQGSAATYVRCGGMYYVSLVANFLLFPAAKEYF